MSISRTYLMVLKHSGELEAESNKSIVRSGMQEVSQVIKRKLEGQKFSFEYILDNFYQLRIKRILSIFYL
ncbi:glycoside hydrolase family 1 protein (macronuclear) [Tetrahymena thermophila SB210]|uniref:Glycoside hydrolase family 1 protein n=1 Tax=Tetrahymena thermophila (strain SB210) TaxID=312017 RepID=I7M0K3_TETTS|nr:glycoside hydrolase family 1 protein [Tetrahymena thermophila SB210]EAR89279.2 glycoside hydrolase family 1 protein [Tetrahymena thermophila SB210]|eukprot:XP_001009524.2 glycoside hydrolase family 1 protein [Tetrahymena thermophila SB210]